MEGNGITSIPWLFDSFVGVGVSSWIQRSKNPIEQMFNKEIITHQKWWRPKTDRPTNQTKNKQIVSKTGLGILDYLGYNINSRKLQQSTTFHVLRSDSRTLPNAARHVAMLFNQGTSCHGTCIFWKVLGIGVRRLPFFAAKMEALLRN